MSPTRLGVLLFVLAESLACTGGGGGSGVSELTEPNDSQWAVIGSEGGAFHGKCDGDPDNDQFEIVLEADALATVSLTASFGSGAPGEYWMVFQGSNIQIMNSSSPSASVGMSGLQGETLRLGLGCRDGTPIGTSYRGTIEVTPN